MYPISVRKELNVGNWRLCRIIWQAREWKSRRVSWIFRGLEWQNPWAAKLPPMIWVLAPKRAIFRTMFTGHVYSVLAICQDTHPCLYLLTAKDIIFLFHHPVIPMAPFEDRWYQKPYWQGNLGSVVFRLSTLTVWEELGAEMVLIPS